MGHSSSYLFAHLASEALQWKLWDAIWQNEKEAFFLPIPKFIFQNLIKGESPALSSIDAAPQKGPITSWGNRSTVLLLRLGCQHSVFLIVPFVSLARVMWISMGIEGWRGRDLHNDGSPQVSPLFRYWFKTAKVLNNYLAKLKRGIWVFLSLLTVWLVLKPKQGFLPLLYQSCW